MRAALLSRIRNLSAAVGYLRNLAASYTYHEARESANIIIASRVREIARCKAVLARRYGTRVAVPA